MNSTTGQALYGSPSTATLEDRSYLDNPRTYGGSMTVLRARANALTEKGTTQEIMTNSYPGAEPYVTEDGALMAFLHDYESDELDETRASYVDGLTIENGGSNIHPFPEPETTSAQAKGNVEQATGGDSQLRLAGTKDNAVAVWSRVTETLEKEPGSAVTSDEQMLMMNSTEIFASVMDDGKWTTTRLTTNSSADMAPVAATNGHKALVAWRAVAAQNSAQLTTFDSYDTIQYKIYDYEDDNWSGPYTLYNGTSGAVKGIEAQMTASGKMAVAYTFEKGSQESTTQVLAEDDGTTSIISDLQTVFAMIEQEGESYEVTKNVQVTDDDDVNENPQLTAVTFPNENEESFLLGWYSVHDEDGVQKNDIRLAAFTSEGLLRDDFVDSLSVVSSQTAGNITSNFRFSKGAEQLSDLSILWTQVEGSDFAGLTASIQLTEMGASQTIESFDGWVQKSSGSLQAVTLSTQYGVKGIDGKTYHTEEVPGVNNDGTASGETTVIAVPNSQANLLLVTGSYSDSIALELPLPDYQALLEGASSIPVQVGVTNQGTQPITQLTFTVGGKSQEFSGLKLQPGESTDLTLDYTVQNSGGKITCPEYSVTATFSDNITVTEKGDVEINLNVHDLGISTFQDTEQANGQRVLQFSLFNNSPAKLESSGKNVVVGVFSDSSCTVPIDKKYLNFGEGEETEREYTFTTTELSDDKKTEETKTETITTKVLSLSDEDLALIDNGAYQGQLTFNLKGYAHDNKDDFLEKGEIRDAGISLYLKVWVEETDEKNQLQELGEVITGNNTQGLTLNSLMKDSDEQVTISGDVTTDDAGNTVVTPTLQNNSLNATARGYLIVDLLDENGNLLESKQTYTMSGGTPSSLITLGEEAVVTLDPLNFSQKGSSVKYRFGQHLDASSTKLTGISLTGIPLAFDENTNTYFVTVDKDLSQTILTLTQAYLGAQIKVNGQLYDGSAQISLPTGTTTLTIEVTSGAETHTYTVHITRPSGGSSGSQGGTGGAARYPVSLSGEVEHGSVTISPTRVTAGQTVTLTPKADEGYELRKLQVIGPDGGEIALTKKADGTYTFKMPKGSVKVTAVFGCDGTGDCPSKNFTDLGENQWYHDYIDYAVEHGLLEGTSPTTMEPNATLTRAQLAQILYNLEGKPAVTGDLPFEDVPEGQWYYAAILWANQEGVVDGMSPDTFAPNEDISRQDLALMLYRYAGEPTVTGDLDGFKDAGQVGDWAEEAITWAVEEGIIDGMTPTTLEPTGTATRAQAAAMLQRFLEG